MPGPSPIPVRPARRADADLLATIEAEGDRQFEVLFGPLDWTTTPGTWRLSAPGFVLVAGDPVVGFAHVLEIEGAAHLEQLAVRPSGQRRGTGTALVRAAQAEAAARGHATLSLCTYADVPWNAPFYRRLGFVELGAAELGPLHRRLLEKEADLGLDRHGRRVVMRGPTRAGAPEVTGE